MMTKEDIKQKEDRLGEMYLAYYRLFTNINDKYMKLEKLKQDLTVLAEEIELDYLDLSKEKDNGEKLC